jgi:hypothetical protein
MGIWGVAAIFEEWNQQEHDQCPRCGQRETAEHTSSCKGKGTQQLWMSTFEDLEEYMEELKTSPEVTKTIIG